MQNLFLFAIGSIFGSFFGLVIDRFDTDESILRGRSHCNTCRQVLSFWDLIPIFSQLFHKFRCRYCAAKIPFNYLLLEISTGFCFVAFFSNFIDLAQLIILLSCIILSSFDIKKHEFPLVIWLFFAGLLVFLFPVRPLSLSFLILAGIAEIRAIKIGSGDFLWLFLASFSLTFTSIVWLIQIASLLGIFYFGIKKVQEIAFIPFLSIAYLTLLIWVQIH